MIDCVCSDHCRGERGGPGCTSEPAHRSLAEAAFGPVTLSPSECAAFEMWLQRCTSEPTPTGGGDRPPYLAARAPYSFTARARYRVIRFSPSIFGDSHRDYGDEDDGRGGGAR